jgi:hypothetical protein
MDSYELKYLKYKRKYLELKKKRLEKNGGYIATKVVTATNLYRPSVVLSPGILNVESPVDMRIITTPTSLNIVSPIRINTPLSPVHLLSPVESLFPNSRQKVRIVNPIALPIVSNTFFPSNLAYLNTNYYDDDNYDDLDDELDRIFETKKSRKSKRTKKKSSKKGKRKSSKKKK